jgi:hypothetical protein
MWDYQDYEKLEKDPLKMQTVEMVDDFMLEAIEDDMEHIDVGTFIDCLLGWACTAHVHSHLYRNDDIDRGSTKRYIYKRLKKHFASEEELPTLKECEAQNAEWEREGLLPPDDE